MAGIVAIIGGLIFFAIQLPSIGGYLVASGLIFLAFTLGWTARYQRVLREPPDTHDGWEPTGETYLNPGGDGPVAVWHKGIKRVYVKVPNARHE
ncbi:MAG: hypothetical protein M1318_05970 [Firmicutes bacterium]|nr:hypothetical protein [Bacillota bacterium]